jgi:hypothetical protein
VFDEAGNLLEVLARLETWMRSRAQREPCKILSNTTRDYLPTRAGRSYIGGMHRWRVLIVGRTSGRPVGSVMARDEASARKKALDFYEIEPALLRVVAVRGKAKPRDLVTRWLRFRLRTRR